VAKRRLYLSFGFYTGAHTVDLDKLVSERVRLTDFGCLFQRHNQKSARALRDDQRAPSSGRSYRWPASGHHASTASAIASFRRSMIRCSS
jgi:hypothetical protein